MKLFLIFTLVFSLNAFAEKDRGGINNETLTKKEIEYLLNSDILKNAIIDYLENLNIDTIETKSNDGKIVKAAFSRMLKTDQLQNDILSKGNYVVSDSCKDYYSNEVPASAVIGEFGGEICFNTAILAKDFMALSGNDLMVKLASLALHEHTHHFQDPQVDIETNEHEAYAVAAYVELTAKTSGTPSLKWRPEGFISVCDRHPLVAKEIMRALIAVDCAEIKSAELSRVVTLNLNRLRLESISSSDFQGLIKLQYLFMEENSLKELPRDLFQELISLKTLGLNNNDLETLPEDLFATTPYLDVLHISKNKLKTLPGDLFKPTRFLTALYLGFNQLEELSFVSGLKELERLNIESNQIKYLDLNWFAEFDPEVTINYSNNPMSEESLKLISKDRRFIDIKD